MEIIPDLVTLPMVAELTGIPRGTLHSHRGRQEYDKLPPEDATVSTVPVWLKARWTAPDQPLPVLPPIVGVWEAAALFGVKPGTVRSWLGRGIGAPEPQKIIGVAGRSLRVWTVESWIDFAERTGRPVRLPGMPDAFA